MTSIRRSALPFRVGLFKRDSFSFVSSSAGAFEAVWAVNGEVGKFKQNDSSAGVLERWGGPRVDKDENKEDDDRKRLSPAVDRGGNKAPSPAILQGNCPAVRRGQNCSGFISEDVFSGFLCPGGGDHNHFIIAFQHF